MTDAELRVVREYLGLTIDALAAILGVDVRTIRRWETGSHVIPDGVATAIEALEAQAAQFVTGAIEALEEMRDPAEAPLVTYRRDEDYWAHHPEMHPYPASYHRAAIARIAQEVPGLEIAYIDSLIPLEQ